MSEVGTFIMLVGENPYSINIGFVPVMLAIMSGLLILYGIVTCVRCCLKQGRGSFQLVQEYEKREWLRSAEKRYKKIISESTKLQYDTKEHKYSQKTCAICLTDFEIECHIRSLKCSHIFHSNCIEAWIKAKINEVPKCPVCNSELIAEIPPGTQQTDILADLSNET